MNIGRKLNIGSQQSFNSILWVAGNLLKLIDSHIHLPLALGKIVEYRFECHGRLAGFDTYGNGWCAGHGVNTEYRTP